MFHTLLGFMGGSVPLINFVLELFSLLVILFVAFPIHECAHGVMAKILGDDTAERSGRLTLNPLAHIDPFGAISMLLFGIGWAKPVPIDVNNCRKVKSGKLAMVLTAAAGPLSNLILSYLFIIIFKIIFFATGGQNEIANYVCIAINSAASINIYLAVFNLIPIPPFDGSRIFLAFLKPKTYFSIMKYERFIMIGIMLVLFTGILSVPLSFVSNAVYSGLDFLTGFVNMIFSR